MGFFSFEPVKRPDPILPDSTLDEELQKSAEDASLMLYFVNMVVVSASDLPNADGLFDKTDPYCEVTVGSVTDRTETIQNDLNPVWNKRMSFFVPHKPDKVLLQMKDEDDLSKDDEVGLAHFEFGSFFETGGSWEGDLDITTPKGSKKGTIRIHVKCRTLKPVETEIKLNHAKIQLECLGKQQTATEAALDESEELRKQVVGQLDSKEQEILQKAAELEEAVTTRNKELSEKDRILLERAQEIEAKVQEKEEAEVARRQAELEKQEAETKLTAAEQEIMAKAKLLEDKERDNKEALTKKEQEILEVAEKLEEKEKANRIIQERLLQVGNLKTEVENELTSKEKIIQEQARQLEIEAQEHDKALSVKDQELLEKAKALEEKDNAAKEAQAKQDESDAELLKLRQQNEEFQAGASKAQMEQEEAGVELAKLRDKIEKLQAENTRLLNEIEQNQCCLVM